MDSAETKYKAGDYTGAQQDLKKAIEQPTSATPTPQGGGLEGNISVPGEKDLFVEEPMTSEDENVDMGSLI